jgi:hypothetical protein
MVSSGLLRRVALVRATRQDKIGFKNKLSLYLMNNSFYTVSEYVEYNIIS